MKNWWQRLLAVGLPIVLAGIIGLVISLVSNDMIYLEVSFMLIFIVNAFILNCRWMASSKKKFKKEKYPIFTDPAEEEKRRNKEMLEEEMHKINTLCFIAGLIVSAGLALISFLIR